MTITEVRNFINEYLSKHTGTGISRLQDILINNNMMKIIDDWCPQIISKFPFGHRIYWFLNDITEFPKCKVCGCEIHSIAKINGYMRQQGILCSVSCNAKYPPNIQARIQRCREKYGVDSPNQLQSKKDKYKKTCLEHYGVPNSMQSKIVQDKSKKTLMDRYGVDTTWKMESVKQKTKQTNLKRYGVENVQQNHEINCKTRNTLLRVMSERHDEIMDSKKKTCIERYGVEHQSKSKVVRDKVEKTNMERYGFKTNLLCKETKEKIQKTNIEKYGYTNPNKNESVKQKLKNTNNERYGSNSPMSDPTIKQKIVDSTMKHYGVPCSLMAEEIKQKSRKTCLEKFGVVNCMQCHEIRVKSLSKYKYEEMFFDSAPELALYIYLKDNNIDFEYQPKNTMNYVCEGKTHTYFPDFKIQNNYIEIKGEHFFENDVLIDPYDRSRDNIALAKFNCMKQNNVKILREKEYQKYIDYIELKYGKNYLQSFKCTDK